MSVNLTEKGITVKMKATIEIEFYVKLDNSNDFNNLTEECRKLVKEEMETLDFLDSYHIYDLDSKQDDI